jgi:hypothetical protein
VRARDDAVARAARVEAELAEREGDTKRLQRAALRRQHEADNSKQQAEQQLRDAREQLERLQKAAAPRAVELKGLQTRLAAATKRGDSIEADYDRRLAAATARLRAALGRERAEHAASRRRAVRSWRYTDAQSTLY